MENIVKKYKGKSEFEWELYALQSLEGTGVAPKLISTDEVNLTIIMERIDIPPVKIFEIMKAGDQAIYNFAVAEYKLRVTLDDAGVNYYDWKAEHVLYDPVSNSIRLIDYSGDQTQKIKGRDKKK